jgi:pimeloyl-ACP methyl ester carboxylesterase
MRPFCSQFTRREVTKALVIAAVATSLKPGRSESRPKSTSNQEQPNWTNNPPLWQTLPPTPVLPSSTRTDWLTINGTPIFFAQFGAVGPQVLFLHGGLANSNYWGLQIEELAKSFSVTVMDTRGHGRSPILSREFSYQKFAEDAASLLDHLQIHSVSIVGWSDGAITGLQLAMSRPDRVSKLFAFGANGTVDGLKRDQTGMVASFIKRCQSEYKQLSPTPEKWWQLVAGLRGMWRAEPNFTRQKLQSLKVPITISDGDHDEIIKLEHTKRIASEIPGARLEILQGVSHFAMLQNPAQFNKAVIDFLTAEAIRG